MRRTKAESTVWGATRAYRSDCLADLMALEPCMGWDGLDEISVQLRGLRTQTFIDLPFRHHRPEGGRELSSLHQGEALGRAAWYMGYRPTYLTLRALYRARQEPAAHRRCCGATSAPPGGARRSARTGSSSRRCASASGWASRCGAAPPAPDQRTRSRSRTGAERCPAASVPARRHAVAAGAQRRVRGSDAPCGA